MSILLNVCVFRSSPCSIGVWSNRLVCMLHNFAWFRFGRISTCLYRSRNCVISLIRRSLSAVLIVYSWELLPYSSTTIVNYGGGCLVYWKASFITHMDSVIWILKQNLAASFTSISTCRSLFTLGLPLAHKASSFTTFVIFVRGRNRFNIWIDIDMYMFIFSSHESVYESVSEAIISSIYTSQRRKERENV